MEQQVNFKKVRDFGEIFNDTFSFIRAEFKPLGKAILLYALPLLVITAIVTVFISIAQQKFIGNMQAAGAADIDGMISSMMSMYKYTFMSMVVYIVSMSVLQCTIYGYIKLYISKGKGQFVAEDVWPEIKRYVLPVIGISFVYGVLVVIGTMLCILPGIFVGVSFSLMITAYIFEGKGFGDAFSRSFTLTAKKWWLTLGLIIVAFIMVYLMAIVLSLPAVMMGFKSFFTAMKTSQVSFSTSFYIVNAITSLFVYILFSLPSIVLIFHYFSLVEASERPSLQQKIEDIN